MVNSYNTFLAGPTKLDKELPPTIGQVKSTSPDEMRAAQKKLQIPIASMASRLGAHAVRAGRRRRGMC